MDENLGLFGVCGIRMGTFDPEHVKVISGHSVHFSPNWAITWKWFTVK